MKNRPPFRPILLVVAALLACPGPLQDGVFRPMQSPPNKPGLVAVITPNHAPGAAQLCPVMVYVVEVGAGVVQSRTGATFDKLGSYLPPNEVDPKAGCIGKECPRMTLFFNAPSSSIGTQDDGGTAADPCAGNPMMPGVGGGAGIPEAALVKLAREADLSREAQFGTAKYQ
jgi:hypothetical protein